MVTRSKPLSWQATRRAGVSQKPVLPRGLCAEQNLILVEYAADAVVEVHDTHVPESVFIISGRLQIDLPDESFELGPDEAVFFEPGSAHGMRVIEAPVKALIVFTRAPVFLRD